MDALISAMVVSMSGPGIISVLLICVFIYTSFNLYFWPYIGPCSSVVLLCMFLYLPIYLLFHNCCSMSLYIALFTILIEMYYYMLIYYYNVDLLISVINNNML